MRNIVFAFLVVLLPALSIALNTGSFKWGEFTELDESTQWEIENNKGKQKIFAFVERGPIVFETRKGEEYGYMVDSVVIHDYERNKTYYTYIAGILNERIDYDMRGFEPQYTDIKVLDDRLVRIEIMGKGKIDGYGLFDIRKPSFQYIPKRD